MKNINNTIKYFLVLVAAFLFIGIPAALAEGRTDTEVDTLNPSQILATSAYLNAFISPSDDQGIFTGNHTEAWFEWGTDSDSMGNATTILVRLQEITLNIFLVLNKDKDITTKQLHLT